MYVVPPPSDPLAGDASAAAATTSVAGDDDLKEMVRTYKAWKGSNIFWLGGRIIFGPDARSLPLTMFLIVPPAVVFCVFVGRKLMHDFSDHWGIAVLVIPAVLTFLDMVFLMLTSARDPGIVPRNTYPPEPEGYDGDSGYMTGQTPPFRLPRTKDVIINGITVKTKYCDTCMLYRPPRCSHCSICNNCVEKFDHHCPWVGQCIGLRNYRFFFSFVLSTTLLCLYVHGFCWVYIRKIMDSEGTSIWKAMIKTPASIVLVIYTFIGFWFVGGLTAFHLYLISKNQSTYENFRYRYDGLANPFDKGVISNIMEVFCSSIPPSKNNFRAKIPKEPTLPPRMMGSSFVSSSIEKSAGDIEMGLKPPLWDDNGGLDSNDDKLDEDSELSDASPHLSRILPPQGVEEWKLLHSRRPDLERMNENLEVHPDFIGFAAGVGESRRLNSSNGGNGNSLTSDTSQEFSGNPKM